MLARYVKFAPGRSASKPKPLSNLPGSKIILVPVPKATATGIVAVMADAIAFEVTVLIPHGVFQRIQVERRILALDAGPALLRLHLD